MRVWWVNQGTTFETSRRLGCLWAPSKTYRGLRQTYWATMAEIRRNDVIVHCSKGKVLALSIALSDAYEATRPKEFRSEAWIEDQGTRVDVDYFMIRPPIHVRSVASRIQELAIAQGPLNKKGMPKQSYMHRFTLEGLRLLRDQVRAEWPKWASQ